jgi:predicted transcriptional regulator
MAKNNKPILSVLVDEEKKERFSALAKEHNYSMGWLLNQAIDKMLEAGTIHIYRDSIASASTNIAPSADIEELVRSYVDKAITPLSNEYVQKNSWDDLRADVADLRSQLTELKTDNDMTAASIKRLIAEAISKASISQSERYANGTTGNPSQKARAATTAQSGQSTQDAEVQKWVRRLEANPELRAAIEAGLSQNLTGKALTEWVFSKGFGANENTKAFDPSVTARMRGAIEYLNGGQG